MVAEKQCTGCKQYKHAIDFNKTKSSKDGLYVYCRICSRQRDKEYRKTSQYRESQKRYHKTDQCRKSIREALRRYKRTAYGAAKTKLRSHARRARELGLDVQLSHEDIRLIFNNFDHKCFNCQSTDNLQIDHHYPLSLGYSLCVHNAVILCKSCNTSKGKKLPEQFYTPQQLEALCQIK